MKKTERLSPMGSSPPRDQPGTSRDALEEMRRDLASQEASRGTLVPLPKKTSYSAEMHSAWRNIRWFQIPLSSLRRPKAGLFSFTFQSSLQKYQQLRKTKRLKVGRPFFMLPLPGLPSTLDECSQETSRKRNDDRRCSRAEKARGSKSLSSHRKGHQPSQGVDTKLQKHSSSACFLPKRYVFCSRTPQEQEKEPSSCSSKKWRKIKPGCSEKDLTLGAQSLPCVSLPAHPAAETAGSSDEFRVRDSACSPLEEDDQFPPRIEFLYSEDPPALSPAPGPESKSQCWEEMPDITQGSVELPMMELAAEASPSAGDHLLFPGESVVMQLKEHESGEVASPGHSLTSFCQVQEGGILEDQAQADYQKSFDLEEHPSLPSPTHPLSTVHFQSSSSATSDEFSGGRERLACESDGEGELGPEHPTLSPTAFLPVSSSRMSSTCSISASLDELSDDPGGLTQTSDMEEDSDDDGLLSLEELLRTSDTNSSSVEPNTTFLSPELDHYPSKLDKLLDEKRKQAQEDSELERSVVETLLPSSLLSSIEVAEENKALFPKAHRLILEFSINRGTIPPVHPGERVFWLSSYPRTALALDTVGLKPQNQLERLFFSSQFTHQMALLQDGILISLYQGQSSCPRTVLRWLFQLMTLNLDVSAGAFKTLWEISAHQIASADKVSTNFWCPTLNDITQAFCNLGASTSALYPDGLFPPEFRPKDMEFPEHPSRSAGMESEITCEETPSQLILAAMLGNVFKFLTLCVASHPHRYPDQQRLALLALFCRLRLDRNLRKQPNMELQQLLLVLLEGIQDWLEKMPELCDSLCHISSHHHNMVAVMRSFPDTTARGRQLRRSLSLCFMVKLLGTAQVARTRWQEENQLQQLIHLLPLMKPSSLKQGLQKDLSLPEQPRKDQQETLAKLDQEACYLCYSLLQLANVVVGTKAVPSRDQGHLTRLCTQLQQHISATIREDPCLMYRTELKDLAAQTYFKWKGLLPWGWQQTTLPAGPE